MHVAIPLPVPPRRDSMAIEGLVPLLARCWRHARDRRAAVQVALHRVLAPRGWGILAPVFDGLMTMAEAALGRPIAVGAGADLSDDERLLLDLLAGTPPRCACLDCADGARRALDCSLCSTRIMLALALDPAPAA